MLGYGRYATATLPIGMRLLRDGCGDDRQGCWDEAFGRSSEFDSSSHPDSSSTTKTHRTGHVIMNHSVVTSNRLLRNGHCRRGDKGKVDAAASAGGTGTNCGHVFWRSRMP
eukprot:scaffold176099_cov31-Attheya_sp.AAC.1